MKPFNLWNMLLLLSFSFNLGIVMADTIDDNTRALVIRTMVEKLRVSKKEISITHAEKINWSSSALGCPVKGQSYLAEITPGFLLKVAVKSTVYSVHTSKNYALICDNRRGLKNKIVSVIAEKETATQVKAIQLARKMLLSSAKNTAMKVHLLSIKKQSWREIKNHCASEPVFAKHSNGFLLELEYAGEKSRYFSDGLQVTKCQAIK